MREGGTHARNNVTAIITIHEMLRKQAVFSATTSRFTNYEGKSLNPSFLEFWDIWETNMVVKLRELSDLPTVNEFTNIELIQSETEEDIVEDEDAEEETDDD